MWTVARLPSSIRMRARVAESTEKSARWSPRSLSQLLRRVPPQAFSALRAPDCETGNRRRTPGPDVRAKRDVGRDARCRHLSFRHLNTIRREHCVGCLFARVIHEHDILRRARISAERGQRFDRIVRSLALCTWSISLFLNVSKTIPKPTNCSANPYSEPVRCERVCVNLQPDGGPSSHSARDRFHAVAHQIAMPSPKNFSPWPEMRNLNVADIVLVLSCCFDQMPPDLD